MIIFTMIAGSIIRVQTEVLFNERAKRRNKQDWVYGVLGFLEDKCERLVKNHG